MMDYQGSKELMDHAEHPPYAKWHSIFTRTYYIELKSMYAYTPFQLEVLGIPTLGDKHWDESIANQLTTTPLTISELADLLDNKIPFYFKNPNDIVNIYDCIERYVKFMVELFNKEYIPAQKFRVDDTYRNVLQDLELLVDLANYLVSHVRQIRGGRRIPGSESNFGEHMRPVTLSRFGFKSPQEKYEETHIIDRGIKLTDLMSENIRTGTRVWRRKE